MSAVDKAPERIWLDLPSFNGAVGFAHPEHHRKDGWPEYIRADLAAPSAPAEVEGLVREWVDGWRQCGCMDAGCRGRHAERDELLDDVVDELLPRLATALTALQARAEKAEGERDEAHRQWVFWRDEADERAAEKGMLHSRLQAIANDYWPDRAADSELSLSEMRGALVDLINLNAPAALAEIVKKAVDAETWACAEMVRDRRQGWLVPYILARLDQRKEAGE